MKQIEVRTDSHRQMVDITQQVAAAAEGVPLVRARDEGVRISPI